MSKNFEKVFDVHLLTEFILIINSDTDVVLEVIVDNFLFFNGQFFEILSDLKRIQRVVVNKENCRFINLNLNLTKD